MHLLRKNLKILLVSRNAQYGIYVETLIRELERRALYSIEIMTLEELSASFNDNFSKKFIFKLKSAINYSIIEHEEYRKDWKPSKFLALLINATIRSLKLHKIKAISFFLCKIYTIIERNLSVDSEITSKLSEIDPDMVIVFPNNWANSGEYEILRICKRMNIATINPIISLDNIYTKGILLDPTDFVLVWNQSQAEYLIHKHHLNKKNIFVVGSLYFEYYYTKYGKLKFTSHKQENILTVLYLGSSPRIANFRKSNGLSGITAEVNVLNKLLLCLERIAIEKEIDVSLTIRTHPMIKKVHLPENSSDHVKITIDYATSPKLIGNTTDQMHEKIIEADYIFGLNTSALVIAKVLNSNTFAIVDEEFLNVTSLTPHLAELINSESLQSLCINDLYEYIKKNTIDSTNSKSIFSFLGIDQDIMPSYKASTLIEKYVYQRNFK